jgi:hypothetical protein
MKPTALLAMFHTPQLEAVAQEVEATIVKIMQEAASGWWTGRRAPRWSQLKLFVEKPALSLELPRLPPSTAAVKACFIRELLTGRRSSWRTANTSRSGWLCDTILDSVVETMTNDHTLSRPAGSRATSSGVWISNQLTPTRSQCPVQLSQIQSTCVSGFHPAQPGIRGTAKSSSAIRSPAAVLSVRQTWA